MRLHTILLFLIGVLYSSENLRAQDIIRKKDNSIVKARIIEITDTTVIYYILNDPYEIKYEVLKSEIDRIFFLESGRSEVSYDYWNGTPDSAVKFGVTSLAQYTVQLGYEKLITSRISAEGTFNLHLFLTEIEGPIQEASGFGLDVGIKYRPWFSRKVDENLKVNSLLSGTYIKGVLAYSKREEVDFFEINNYWAVIGGLQIGHTFNLGEKFNIDVFVGGHVFTGSNESSPLDRRFTIPSRLMLQESNYIGENNLAVSFGLKMGYYLGKYKAR